VAEGYVAKCWLKNVSRTKNEVEFVYDGEDSTADNRRLAPVIVYYRDRMPIELSTVLKILSGIRKVLARHR
jgi:hypothetical protein